MLGSSASWCPSYSGLLRALEMLRPAVKGVEPWGQVLGNAIDLAGACPCEIRRL